MGDARNGRSGGVLTRLAGCWRAGGEARKRIGHAHNPPVLGSIPSRPTVRIRARACVFSRRSAGRAVTLCCCAVGSANGVRPCSAVAFGGVTRLSDARGRRRRDRRFASGTASLSWRSSAPRLAERPGRTATSTSCTPSGRAVGWAGRSRTWPMSCRRCWDGRSTWCRGGRCIRCCATM
jgi:hypothetical protein